jgi:hypothetical protein
MILVPCNTSQNGAPCPDKIISLMGGGRGANSIPASLFKLDDFQGFFVVILSETKDLKTFYFYLFTFAFSMLCVFSAMPGRPS